MCLIVHRRHVLFGIVAVLFCFFFALVGIFSAVMFRLLPIVYIPNFSIFFFFFLRLHPKYGWIIKCIQCHTWMHIHATKWEKQTLPRPKNQTPKSNRSNENCFVKWQKKKSHQKERWNKIKMKYWNNQIIFWLLLLPFSSYFLLLLLTPGFCFR